MYVVINKRFQVYKQFKTMKSASLFKDKANISLGGNYIILSPNDSKIFLKKEKELKTKLQKLLNKHKENIQKLYKNL